MSKGNSWELQGSNNDTRLGEQLVILDHPNGETELVIRSIEHLYLVTLDASVLTNLDLADDAEDRQIELDHCESVDGCAQLELGALLNVTDVSSAGDFDEDGKIDIGVVAFVSEQGENLLVYFLSRAGFSQIEPNTDEDPIRPCRSVRCRRSKFPPHNVRYEWHSRPRISWWYARRGQK